LAFSSAAHLASRCWFLLLFLVKTPCSTQPSYHHADQLQEIASLPFHISTKTETWPFCSFVFFKDLLSEETEAEQPTLPLLDKFHF